MGVMASQITSLTIVYSTVYSGADQRKHQSSAALAVVRGIHRWPVNSPHKWPVRRKMFPFDDVIMNLIPHLSVYWAWDYLWFQAFHICKRRPMSSTISEKSCSAFRIITSITWWSRQMEAVSALLAFCEGIHRPPHKGPVVTTGNAGFVVFFDVSLNQRLNKQLTRRWFETPWCSLWRHRNDFQCFNHGVNKT